MSNSSLSLPHTSWLQTSWNSLGSRFSNFMPENIGFSEDKCYPFEETLGKIYDTGMNIFESPYTAYLAAAGAGIEWSKFCSSLTSPKSRKSLKSLLHVGSAGTLLFLAFAAQQDDKERLNLAFLYAGTTLLNLARLETIKFRQRIKTQLAP